MIKKITLGLTALLSVVSLPSIASPIKSFDVTVPCYNGGFIFGLAGLYLKPSTDALDYGLVYPATSSSGPIVSPAVLLDGSVRTVDPDYDWGYQINVGYLFPNSGNDLTLTYSHYNTSDTDKVTLGRDEILIGTITPFLLAASEINVASDAKAKFQYQAIDLELGQHVNVGCNAHLRFFSGLRFADLDHHFHANYRGATDINFDAVPDTFLVNTSQKSEFKGVGPQVGMNTAYSLGGGFGISGKAAAALLVGNIKSSYQENDLVFVGTTNLFNETFSYSYPRETRVVPNLNAKLGLNYNYQFCNASRSAVTVEAGYQVDRFYNSADRLSGVGLIGSSESRGTMDVSFAGPYVSLEVKV